MHKCLAHSRCVDAHHQLHSPGSPSHNPSLQPSKCCELLGPPTCPSLLDTSCPPTEPHHHPVFPYITAVVLFGPAPHHRLLLRFLRSALDTVSWPPSTHRVSGQPYALKVPWLGRWDGARWPAVTSASALPLPSQLRREQDDHAQVLHLSHLHGAASALAGAEQVSVGTDGVPGSGVGA